MRGGKRKARARQIGNSADPLKYLVYFHHTQAGRGFDAAGDALEVERSTAYRGVKRLEQHLGELSGKRDLQLFASMGRKPALTEMGKRLHDRIREPIEALLVAMQPDSLQRLFSAKPIRYVGVSSFVAAHFLPRAMRTLNAACPDFNIQIKEYRAQEMFDLLANGRLDVGVGPIAMLSRLRAGVRVIARAPSYTIKYRLIASKNTFIGKRSTWQDLQRRKWVLYRTGTATREAMEKQLQSEGMSINQLECLFECADELAMARFVAENDGVVAIVAVPGDTPIGPGIKEHEHPRLPEVKLSCFARPDRQEERFERAFVDALRPHFV